MKSFKKASSQPDAFIKYGMVEAQQQANFKLGQITLWLSNYHRLIVILALFFQFTQITHGQFNINMQKGYVVTLANDTLHGLINDGGSIRNSYVCIFKLDNQNAITKYYPKDIKAYRFVGDKYYCSKEIMIRNKPENVFLEVLIDGDIDLYTFWKGNNKKYYIEDKNGKLMLLSREMHKMNKKTAYNLQKPADTWIEIASYKDTLFSVFSDCKKVQDQVETLSYSKESIFNITKSYLNENCKGNNCIKYEKDFNPSKPYFGIFTGVQMSQLLYWQSTAFTENTGNTVNKKEFDGEYLVTIPIGILYNFPLHFISEKLSFQMELITSTIKYTQPTINSLIDSTYKEVKIDSRILEIPFLLKYRLSKNKFSPTIALGKSTNIAIWNEKEKLFNTQRGGWFAEIGLNYRIKPRLSFFTNLRVQKITSMVIDDSRLNNQSFSHADVNNLYRHKFETNIATLYVGFNF
jgi:hypothetical protein